MIDENLSVDLIVDCFLKASHRFDCFLFSWRFFSNFQSRKRDDVEHPWTKSSSSSVFDTRTRNADESSSFSPGTRVDRIERVAFVNHFQPLHRRTPSQADIAAFKDLTKRDALTRLQAAIGKLVLTASGQNQKVWKTEIFVQWKHLSFFPFDFNRTSNRTFEQNSTDSKVYSTDICLKMLIKRQLTGKKFDHRLRERFEHERIWSRSSIKFVFGLSFVQGDSVQEIEWRGNRRCERFTRQTDRRQVEWRSRNNDGLQRPEKCHFRSKWFDFSRFDHSTARSLTSLVQSTEEKMCLYSISFFSNWIELTDATFLSFWWIRSTRTKKQKKSSRNTVTFPWKSSTSINQSSTFSPRTKLTDRLVFVLLFQISASRSWNSVARGEQHRSCGRRVLVSTRSRWCLSGVLQFGFTRSVHSTRKRIHVSQ